MTELTHKLIEEQILQGTLEWTGFRVWPAPARQHAQGCSECQGQLQLEKQLGQLGAMVRESTVVASMPKPPSLKALQARTAARTAPPAPALLLAQTQGLAPFPEMTSQSLYRNYRSQGALELHRTERGALAHDPLACHLLLYAVMQGGPPILVHQLSRERPGVSLELAHLPEGTRRIVALSSSQAVDPILWGLWLSDVYRSHDSTSLTDLLQGAEHCLHAAELNLDTGFEPSDVRVLYTAERLKPADEETIALIYRAGKLGQRGSFFEASRLYREALERGIEVKDTAGEIQAALGLAIALNCLQFQPAAESVLQALVRRVALDNRNAAWVCREQAQAALNNWELEAAARWLAMAQIAAPEEVARLGQIGLRLNVALGLYDVALRSLNAPWIDKLSPYSAMEARGYLIEAFVGSGQLSEAQVRLQALNEEVEQLKTLSSRGLSWILLRILVTQRSGRVTDWAQVITAVEDELHQHDDGRVHASTLHTLIALLNLAIEAHAAAARHLMRLYFLHTADAADDRISLMGILAVPQGLLVLSGQPGASVRNIRMSRDEFLRLVHTSQQEALTGGTPRVAIRLAEILFPDGIPTGQILLGSNSLLANAPMPYIAAQVGDARPPQFIDLAGPRRRRGAQPMVLPAAVASLADAHGDLPMADAEVASADVFLRRSEVTHRALLELPPVGLLHIGVHSRRERGMPLLVMADGLIGPPEISNLPLSGNPIVLLSGCATGASALHRGVERSMAGAFLSAGASAVIATRWPVQDREMGRFVQCMMTHWPFNDPARVTALVCQQLRREGLPARIWAAPIVY
ncbi:MAG: tetratricopeptide (TPR) repeat protein [Myxococcota bacterium]|jgi:tetratricopeptide (TPR) repeat protein